MPTNEFNIKRVAFGNFTLAPTTNNSIISSDARIPAGAVITGVRVVEGTTLAGANPIAVMVGSNAIIATTAASGVNTGVLAIATTAGFTTSGGALGLSVVNSTAASSALAGDVDVYVEYIFTNDHT